MGDRILGSALRGLGRANGAGSGRSSMEELPTNRPQSQGRIQDRLGVNKSSSAGNSEGHAYRRRRERSGDHHQPHRHGPTSHERMDRELERKRMIYEIIVSLPRFNEISNLPHLLQWLVNKAKDARVEIVQATPDHANGNVVIRVKTAKESHALSRLNGYTYNGQVLTITTRDQPFSGSTPPPIPREFERLEIVQLLQQFITARFSIERRMLDLSAVEKEPVLYRTLGRLTTGSWTAIIKSASEVCPMVETISFNDNGLRTLIPLNGLSHYLPNVINLSFANNQISNPASLKAALGALANLRELVLQGNPIQKEALEGNRERLYRREIADMFPSLQYLDTQPVLERTPGSTPQAAGTEMKFGQLPTDIAPKEAAVLPIIPRGGFFDSEQTRQTVLGFLGKYLHLFDSTDRSTLLEAYSSTAVFSMSIFPVNPVGVRPAARTSSSSASTASKSFAQQQSGPIDGLEYDVSDMDFSLMTGRGGRSSAWTKYDRNLHRSKDKQQRRQLSFTGPLDIAHTLAHLPKTAHKSLDTFVIDAWQIPGSSATSPPRLTMSVHGEMVELEPNTPRFFDRTFILIPALPGSKASTAGWPVEIVNDCLTVRPQVTEDVVRRLNNRSRQNMPDVKNLSQLSEMACLPPVIGPQPSPILPQTPQQQPDATVIATGQPFTNAVGGMLTLQQQQYAMELAKLTGLNVDFSVLCLKEHGWDPARAMEGFKLAKMQGRIPPQAFSA